MHLTHLTLTNFRNYEHLELDLAPGVTLLHGNNAQGKTNLLEAIFFLATGRSPHAGAERELIHWRAASEAMPFARLEAQAVRRGDESVALEIVLVANRPQNGDDTSLQTARVTKRIKVNGVNKRALDLLGTVNVILFLPEDLDLVFGAPSERRRYLDTTLAQIDARYSRALAQYNHVVEQRNALLREFKERAFNAAELETWNDKLIEDGVYVIARRAQAVADTNRLVAAIHPRLTDNGEQLRIVYQPTVPAEADAPLTQIANAFREQLRAMRPRELGAGLTLVGPHRDDLRFFVDGVDMITYASRGQGRTIALSLKMAEMDLMRAETGEEPVLLLDDVMSELDKARRVALSHFIEQAGQALVSAIDLDDFAPELLAQARLLRVSAGMIEPPPPTPEFPVEGEMETDAPAPLADETEEPLSPL